MKRFSFRTHAAWKWFALSVAVGFTSLPVFGETRTWDGTTGNWSDADIQKLLDDESVVHLVIESTHKAYHGSVSVAGGTIGGTPEAADDDDGTIRFLAIPPLRAPCFLSGNLRAGGPLTDADKGLRRLYS